MSWFNTELQLTVLESCRAVCCCLNPINIDLVVNPFHLENTSQSSVRLLPLQLHQEILQAII